MTLRPGPEDPNRTVWQYLAAYCRAEKTPGYAVLVVGPWGTGKTFFVRRLLEQIGQEHLFITLNGVTTPADIEAQIFRQLHPVLSSKAMRLAGVVAKGVLKGTLKIDLNNDGNPEGSLSPNVPDLKLKDIAKSSQGRVLVFDDLERSSMKIAEALGYINAFVEHEDLKAIVIANDKELGDEQEDFQRIKEKLIGQTLEVKPHISAAYPELIATLSDSWTIEFLHRHRVEALSVFALSKTENLRALRQALQDFERFAAALRLGDRSHEAALTEIFQVILALSLDYRTGKLAPEELSKAYVRRMGGARGSGGGEPTDFERTEARYPDLNFRSPWLSPAVLAGLFVQGWVEAEDVQTALDRAPPFIPAAQEAAWRRAWAGYERPDAEFESAMQQVEAEFRARTFTLPGEILHVFGLRLQASRIGLSGLSEAQVIAEGEIYLDDLLKAGELDVPPPGADEPTLRSGFGGLAFLERETAGFETLRKALTTAVAQARAMRRPVEAQALFETMQSDAMGFKHLIHVTNGGPATYWDKAILHHIPAETFVVELLKLPPESQHTVLLALKERYNTGHAKPELAAELPWVIDVRSALHAALPTLRPMSRHRLGTLLSTALDPAIVVLQPYAPAPPPPAPIPAKRLAKRRRALKAVNGRKSESGSVG